MEAVPPVWTTPLSEAALADETLHVVVNIAATATNAKAVMNVNVRIEILPLSFNTVRVAKSAASRWQTS